MHVTLSFDIEEYFQVENLKNVIKKSEWENIQSSVVKNTEKILAILEKYNVRGTFFILGIVAEKFPELVIKIDKLGHEVASHGMSHDLTSELTDKQLESDLANSKKVIETILGKKIYGYRAPSFSINDQVVSILKKLDFKYDSSYNPFQMHGRYGNISNLNKEISYGILELENQLLELPISTISLPKIKFPMGGGAYFRIFPFWFFKQLVSIKLRKLGYYNFYLHPWELQPNQPKQNGLSFNHKFRHYYGLKNTEKKLNMLIEFLLKKNCRFSTMFELIQTI